jgi:hypothetical protein
MCLKVSTDNQTEQSNETGATSSGPTFSRRAFLGAGGSLAAAATVPSVNGSTTSPTTDTPEPTDDPDAADRTAINRLGVPDRTEIDHIEARDVKQVREAFEEADTEYVGPADLGIQPDSIQPIGEKVKRAAENERVLRLPPGDYLIRNRLTITASNWGIVGTGQRPEDVRIHGEGETILINQRSGENVRMENFAMQNGPERGVGMVLIAERNLRVKNVHHRGLSHREGRDGNSEQYNHQVVSLTIQITDPDGIGVVENFVKLSPTEVGGHAQNDSAFGSWGLHEGTVYVRDSKLANGGGDGSTYVSRAPGGWRFTRCRITNTHMSAFRVGGPKDWVVSCTVSISFSESQQINSLDSSPPGMNGIVWETANSPVDSAIGLAGGLVDGCKIVMHDLGDDGSRGAVCVSGSHGGVVVRNTDIINHTYRPSINLDGPGTHGIGTGAMPETPHTIWLENITISGSGSGVAIDNDGRDVNGFNVCIENGNEAQGLPQSALGCAPNNPAPTSRPGYVSVLLRKVDPSTLPSGNGAPPAPSVPGSAGSSTTHGTGGSGAIAEAAAQLLVVLVLLVIGIGVFTLAATAGIAWSLKWIVE